MADTSGFPRTPDLRMVSASSPALLVTEIFCPLIFPNIRKTFSTGRSIPALASWRKPVETVCDFLDRIFAPFTYADVIDHLNHASQWRYDLKNTLRWCHPAVERGECRTRACVTKAITNAHQLGLAEQSYTDYPSMQRQRLTASVMAGAFHCPHYSKAEIQTLVGDAIEASKIEAEDWVEHGLEAQIELCDIWYDRSRDAYWVRAGDRYMELDHEELRQLLKLRGHDTFKPYNRRSEIGRIIRDITRDRNSRVAHTCKHANRNIGLHKIDRRRVLVTQRVL